MEQLWVLTYAYVEDVLERRGPLREEHLALMAELRDAGRLVLIGAVGDPPTGALAIVRDRAVAEDIVLRDPYVAGGLVTEHRIEPCAVPVSVDLSA